ncbi:DEAD/DEAH box helicase [Emcibacter sp. SYSU 3D8]|uniref:DEAD/DEAH box helicase n=1 Tax=Emcibacter sp. SYSU 3D8 TaxID=3133969 RepID=UPI0031FE75E9
MNFEYLGLAPETLRAVEEAGYTTPTPIQAQAIPVVLQGRDVLGIAQTGTGKTAGFTLPMIDILSQGRARARMPRSLILEPTRELAAQVAQSFETYGKYHKLNMALLIGGVSFDEQERKLDRGVDVLIATPGRLLDHFGRGKLMMNGVDILVIDEADRMLDMGFIPDVERICSLITKKHQTLFFSATMPREIQNLVSKFLTDPKRIEVASPSSTATTVEQFLVPMNTSEAGAKRAKLRELLRGEEIKNAIVFCNRKRDVDVVYRSLVKHGFDAAALHGDMDQGSRTEVLEKFKAGNLRLLVASDVAARGLDIPAMSHVFNYDVPSHAEDYIHRIGRTGRAGRSGRTFMISTPADSKWLRNVQNLIGKAISTLTGAAPKPETESPAVAENDTTPAEAPRSEAARNDAPGDDASEEKRGKRRRRSRGGKRGDASKTAAPPQTEDVPVVTQPQDQADVIDEPRRNQASKPRPDKAAGEQRRDEPRRDEPRRQEARRDDNRHRDSRRDDRRDRDRPRDRRPYRDDDFEPVVGLGDHVPEFLLRAFKIAPIAADDDDDEILFDTEAEIEVAAEADTDAEAADAVTAEDTAAAEPQDATGDRKPKRKRRTRSKKPRDAAAESATAETAAAETAVAEAPAESPSPELQPEPVTDATEQQPDSAAGAVQEEPEVPNETPAAEEQPAPKPKRVRKPRAKAAAKPAEPDTDKAETAADEAPAAAEEPKAKPRRRAAKPKADTAKAAADAAAPAGDAPEADAKPKPARKPRAPRKKTPPKAA